MAELDETQPPEPIEEPEQEPETPSEPDEEEEEQEGTPEPQEPEETPEEQPQGLSEKELEAGRKKLEREQERHANRVSEIMGDEAVHLERCPLCSDFVDGWVFPQIPPEEIVQKVRVFIGMPDLSNYQQAKDARQCPDCAGLGVVLSGSL